MDQIWLFGKFLSTVPTENSDTQNSDIFQNSDTLFASTKKIHWFFLNSELKIEPSQFLKTFIVNFIMSRQYLNRYFRRRWIFKLTDLPTMLSNFWLHLMNNFEDIKNFLGHSILGIIIGKVSRRSAAFSRWDVTGSLGPTAPLSRSRESLQPEPKFLDSFYIMNKIYKNSR